MKTKVKKKLPQTGEEVSPWLPFLGIIICGLSVYIRLREYKCFTRCAN
ncbi:LPXTG cell wall anchor domain-containing protein [Enterococcus faecalis]|nr:LPXTG cell wall anchor domain-containing protein [Enterococcus faecalis]EGO5036280.1 LPXTG cell wall anchor domain-containing protein [Enterococcus faecalis]EGO6578211.1 LPXTG cell wall anchor domain-containing protein [Enterococcus faecalis]EGO7700165.1 LPXTG cell wall anchor domain-containing protein [Enterococcus faecalis]EGO7919378.1 LPXTG cell wall anchor domain-containing protein [Enterococcus faecalis]